MKKLFIYLCLFTSMVMAQTEIKAHGILWTEPTPKMCVAQVLPGSELLGIVEPGDCLLDTTGRQTDTLETSLRVWTNPEGYSWESRGQIRRLDHPAQTWIVRSFTAEPDSLTAAQWLQFAHAPSNAVLLHGNRWIPSADTLKLSHPSVFNILWPKPTVNLGDWILSQVDGTILGRWPATPAGAEEARAVWLHYPYAVLKREPIQILPENP
jgi:hypothetical protein